MINGAFILACRFAPLMISFVQLRKCTIAAWNNQTASNVLPMNQSPYCFADSSRSQRVEFSSIRE